MKNQKTLSIKDFKFINAINDAQTEATILINKNIGSYTNSAGEKVNGMNGEQFAQEILWLQDKVSLIHVRISSNGGSIMDAANIYNAIRNSKVPCYTYNDFMCASSAAFILIAGHKRFANDFSSM